MTQIIKIFHASLQSQSYFSNFSTEKPLVTSLWKCLLD